jgi:hypothetical protein
LLRPRDEIAPFGEVFFLPPGPVAHGVGEVETELAAAEVELVRPILAGHAASITDIRS